MIRRGPAVTASFIVMKVVIMIVIVVAMVALGKYAYSFGYKVFAEETVSNPPGKNVAVTIEGDITASDLGELLEKKGLINDSKVFWVQMQLSEYKSHLKGGSYVLNTSQTSEEMLAVLAREDETESETEE